MTKAAPVEVIVQPSRPALATAGRWLGYLAWPWALGFLVAGNELLRAVGYPAEQPPLVLRLAVIAIAAAPGAVWFVTQTRLGQVRGLRRLRAQPQPLARVDRHGIELSLPGHGVRRFDWEAVSRLDVINSWLHQDGRLIGTNGSTLAGIPESLVYPRSPTWRALWTRTLAQVVVEVRPDRYALSGANWAGLLDAFALHEMVRDYDALAADRRRTQIVAAFAAVLTAGAVVGGVAWLVAQR